MTLPVVQWSQRIFEPRATAVEKACLECGRAFWLPPSKANKIQRCSDDCRALWRARQRANPSVGWYELRFTADDAKTPVACAECRRSMWLPASKLKDFRRCSLICNAAYRAAEREKNRRLCETCGKPFYPRTMQLKAGIGRFCSRSCNTAWREAVNTPEIKRLAKQRVKEMIEAGLIIPPRGILNKQWMGGKAAYLERAKLDGRTNKWRREYRRLNPDKLREWSQRRNHRKVGRLPRGTIPLIGKAQKWKCAICRVKLKKSYHTDHITPLAKGGEHIPRNIQLLCGPCNVRKNAKDPIVYMQSLGRLL